MRRFSTGISPDLGEPITDSLTQPLNADVLVVRCMVEARLAGRRNLQVTGRCSCLICPGPRLSCSRAEPGVVRGGAAPVHAWIVRDPS